MPQPKSLIAYQDLIEGLLYPALDTPKGKRVTCLTSNKAFALSMRLRAAIAQLRRQSKLILEPEHPRYGHSDFDSLVIQQEGPVVFIRLADPEAVANIFSAKIEDIL